MAADFWDPEDLEPAPGSTPLGPYSGPLPPGYSQRDVDEWLTRNPGDEHRVLSALTDRQAGHGTDPIAGSATQGGSQFGVAAPPSIQPFTRQFSAPTLEQASASPGFQFRLGEGLKALQRSAAARGTLLTGGTLKSLQGYAQDEASQEYDKVYGRALGEYQQDFGVHQFNEGQRFASQRANRLDDYGIFSGDRAYNRGVFESDRGFGYQQGRDWMNDRFRLIDYGYGASRRGNY